MMKRYIVLLILILSFTNCEKNTIGDFEPLPASEAIIEDALDKKGAAFTNKAKDWSHKTHDLGAHWMYSWGNVLREEIPENVEFVPMFWGKGAVTDENINRLKQLKDEGKIKYLLGFNEPDAVSQANMTVEEAIALWPRLEEIGLPLGSPATVSPNNEWMKTFMQKVEELGLRVDFIAVHHYGGPNVLSFINKLKTAYEDYKRPIWVTEFAVADWSATSPQNNKYSEAQVMEFMGEALEALDAIDWIHRYAWFDGKKAPLITSALFDEDSNITSVGQVYASNKPNIDIGPGVDTDYVPPFDPDEIIVNGGFETGEISPWGGFKNGVVGQGGTTPHTGNFSGKIENGDGSLFTITDVDPGKTYVLRFFSKWSTTVTNSFKAAIRNNGNNDLLFRSDPVPLTDQWEETVFEFEVPSGVTQLKIVFYKGNGFPPFFMDDVSLKEK